MWWASSTDADEENPFRMMMRKAYAPETIIFLQLERGGLWLHNQISGGRASSSKLAEGARNIDPLYPRIGRRVVNNSLGRPFRQGDWLPARPFPSTSIVAD
jgi:hypothetical protein